MSLLDQQLAALQDLDLVALRQRWQEFYPEKAPALMSRELLQLAIGYKLQEEVLGGISRRTQLSLASLKNGSKAIRPIGVTPPPKSGTKLVREWQGEVHEVLTLEDGRFAYRGKTFRSLTLITKLITGAHQSGPRFFGLTKPMTSDVAPRGRDG